MDRDRAAALREAEAAIRGAMADLPAGEVDEFLQTVPPAYLAWVVPAEVREHVGVIIPVPRADEVRTSVHPGRLPGTETLVIGALDRLGLLAMIAGALTLSGLSIVSAQAFTTEHGVALDAFEVRGEFEDEIGPERWERFRSSLRGALAGDFGLKDRLAGLRGHYRRVDAAIPIEVRIDRDASEAFTVLEVGGPDRIGLLFDLASALAEQGVDVHAAKVATYGPRVIDAFYVTDEEGRRLSPDRADQVTSALRSAMAAP